MLLHVPAAKLSGAMAPMRCKPRLQPAMRARRSADTDWPRIAALYDRLRAVMPSPVVDLNRAIAHSMAFGTEAGLRLVSNSHFDVWSD